MRAFSWLLSNFSRNFLYIIVRNLPIV